MITGNGIDIIEIDRIEQAVVKWGDAFLAHFLTNEEIIYSKKFKHPYQHLAGRFAAKEAIFKAFGDSTLTWKDVAIINDKDGKPECHFFRDIKQRRVILSISHSKLYAVASCVIEN